MDVVAIIPAYNEARTITAVVKAVRPHVDAVLVIDDGSADDTSRLAIAAGAQVHRHHRNLGKASAIATGFRQAAGLNPRWIITLDGDGQHPATRLPAMIQLARKHPEDVIIGARMLDREQAPALRRFANGFADFWVSWAAGTPYRDTQSGLRLYPARVAASLPPPSRPEHGFAYESEILIELGQRRHGVIHHPIETLYPENRRPSHYQAWKDTGSIVKMVAARLLRRGLSPRALLHSLDSRRLCVLPAGEYGEQTTDPLTETPAGPLAGTSGTEK
ncbi:MAG: glycosyltransferase family 2 protein [Gammaproteobacteria bacterium]|nr:glycosyltransferase family 2 protein [Gammaproteobacteria bacterium]